MTRDLWCIARVLVWAIGFDVVVCSGIVERVGGEVEEVADDDYSIEGTTQHSRRSLEAAARDASMQYCSIAVCSSNTRRRNRRLDGRLTGSSFPFPMSILIAAGGRPITSALHCCSAQAYQNPQALFAGTVQRGRHHFPSHQNSYSTPAPCKSAKPDISFVFSSSAKS